RGFGHTRRVGSPWSDRRSTPPTSGSQALRILPASAGSAAIAAMRPYGLGIHPSLVPRAGSSISSSRQRIFRTRESSTSCARTPLAVHQAPSARTSRQPSFHWLADDGFPPGRIGSPYVAQVHLVVFPGKCGMSTDELVDPLN